MDDIDDDIMEEACVVNDYHLRSKGAPKTNDFPSTLKTATIYVEISLEQIEDIRRNPTTAQPTTSMDLT